MLKMDEIQRRLLLEVADLHDVPQGAYNLRANGKSVGRSSSANIEITSKEDGSGIDIRIKPGSFDIVLFIVNDLFGLILWSLSFPTVCDL